MNLVRHIVTPHRLFLAWQGPEERKDRYRYAVGEVSRESQSVTLRYFGDEEFRAYNNERPRERVLQLGFGGYPGFIPSKDMHENGVLSALMRRVPSQAREDFPQYRKQFSLASDVALTDFDVLALTEAKLPSDGFSVVDPLEKRSFQQDRDFMFEMAGYRHHLHEHNIKLAVGDILDIQPEPTNEVDAGAVAFLKDEKLLGYINRLQAPAFIEWGQHCRVSAKVERLNGTSMKPRAFVFITVRPFEEARAA